jgi:DNA-binding response OmpR family regulator
MSEILVAEDDPVSQRVLAAIVTYLLLLTSLDGKQNDLQGMDAGADDYLTKPVDPDQLKARLRVAERGHQTPDAALTQRRSPRCDSSADVTTVSSINTCDERPARRAHATPPALPSTSRRTTSCAYLTN